MLFGKVVELREFSVATGVITSGSTNQQRKTPKPSWKTAKIKQTKT